MASFSFSDFPEDVQLRILSFLSPSDLSSFACTSKRFVSLFHGESGVWYAMCDRRWGSVTHIRKWGDGKVYFKTLFKALSEFQNLIGFWRTSGFGSSKPGIIGDAPLVLFEWGVSSLVGSKLLPYKDGTYNVTKSPFIWMKLSKNGEIVNYMKSPESPDSNQNDLVRVSLSYVEKGHVLVEERKGNNNIHVNVNHVQVDYSINNNNNDDGIDEIGSPRDRVTSEMYQYFANRTSPKAGSGERAWRRQRRREKERQERRRWDPQHLVKVVHCSPTPSKPLQGLWKGICNDMSLDFYLVEYNDDNGGISCTRIGDESSNPCSCYLPVFWAEKATLIDPPFSNEEEYLYKTRYHVRPTLCDQTEDHIHNKPITSQIMHINSYYEMLFPDMEGNSLFPGDEGRIWKYVDGSFGFGFLCYNHIVDMKPMVKHGCLLNIVQHSNG